MGRSLQGFQARDHECFWGFLLTALQWQGLSIMLLCSQRHARHRWTLNAKKSLGCHTLRVQRHFRGKCSAMLPLRAADFSKLNVLINPPTLRRPFLRAK